MNRFLRLVFLSVIIGCFLLGYYGAQWVMGSPNVVVPVMLGKSLTEALRLASERDCSVLLEREVEHQECVPGTVLEQQPLPKYEVKRSSVIRIVVAKKPKQPMVPRLIGNTYQDALALAKRHQLVMTWCWVSAAKPVGYCFAQDPVAATPLDKKKHVVAYLSSGGETLKIVPSFLGKPIGDVEQSLAASHIAYSIHHDGPLNQEHQCNNCMVLEQRPHVGSVIDDSKPLGFQFLIGRST